MAGQIVRKMGRGEADGLRDALEAANYEFREIPHAVWAAKGPSVSVTYYASGKLLAQGKGVGDFGLFFLDVVEGCDDAAGGRKPAVPDNPADRVTDPIIGSDETGKGDYFGPLVVAAFLIRADDVKVLRGLGVRDSKSVRDREARTLARQIRDGFGDRIEVISIGPEKYNVLHGKFGGNLNRLLAWAHGQAIQNLVERHGCGRVIVDKFANERVMTSQLEGRGLDVALEQRPRAESHPAVAAASILARSRFLHELERLGKKAGVKLPKGAGWPVDEVARELFAEGGIERLRPLAKIHFKTTQKAQQ